MILQDGKLVNSKKEKWLTQISSMALWILFASNLAFAIESAHLGKIIMNSGCLLMFTPIVLIGPVVKLTEASEGSNSAKILLGMFLFGVMITVTGAIVRFANLTGH